MAEKQEKAPVVAWNPFAELDALRDWRPFEGGLGGRISRLLRDLDVPGPERGLRPAVDLDETDQAYVMSIELPGVRKEDVGVELENGVLTIHGEKKAEREEKTGKRRWIERSYGSFQRSFTLPANALAERIEASFRDGILTVTVPKSEAPKAQMIAIKP